MKGSKGLDQAAMWLAIIGALNWGLVGVGNFNLVSAIFGNSILARIIYVLVGLAGVWMLIGAFKKN